MSKMENIIKSKWNEKNLKNIILYNSETLKMRTVQHEGVNLYLVHNSIRDVYDEPFADSLKRQNQTCPFCGTLDNEILKIDNHKFRILGNKFACMQYQSLFVPEEHIEHLNEDYLRYMIEFAVKHPSLTFLYNSDNAGKAVDHFYWLISFHNYEPLSQPYTDPSTIYKSKAVSIQKRENPAYIVEFEIRDSGYISRVIMELISFMKNKNFNIFIYSKKLYFIPREDIEIPDGFENHRFGGLEMIGYFIMKLEEEFNSVDPKKLINGIGQVSYKKSNQELFESHLISLISKSN